MLEQSLGIAPEELGALGLAGQQPRRTSVGKARLRAVRDCIERTGEVRQADIVKQLGVNSGTVSVATSALRASGEIQAVGKERGSIIWRFTGEAAQAPEVQLAAEKNPVAGSSPAA
jgi:hypothetical protein